MIPSKPVSQSVLDFKGGRISGQLHVWRTLTSDPHILSIVQGDKFDFIANPPVQHFAFPQFSPSEKGIISAEVDKMLSKGVIVKCRHEPCEFVSPIFITEKSDGGHRLILNLKRLNEFIRYEHFKMDSLKDVLLLVTPNCFMAKLDLKDAYYSVRVAPEYCKYLKFAFGEELYKFVCFPNGLGPCPRKFTKLMKVPLSTLRSRGHKVSGYIDDFFTCAHTSTRCSSSVLEMHDLFVSLGFVIHPDKSVFQPSQRIEFLGFLIDSRSMTVELTAKKKASLKKLVSQLLSISSPTIRLVAKVLGTIVSSFPASRYGPLHYRCIDADKTAALQACKGNFDAHMTLSVNSRSELEWWKSHIDGMINDIHLPPIRHKIYCDASDFAWGASFGTYRTGGSWTLREDELHINGKELLAIYFALRAFIDLIDSHILIYTDNTTAVAAINHMGTSRSQQCNELAQVIWGYCRRHSLWVTCTHIPGVDNVDADLESRRDYRDADWMLNPTLFHRACVKCQFVPDIDCFASRINSQLDRYISFKPDPFAEHIDAFSVNWGWFDNPYLFPPFSVIGQALQKLRVDKVDALMVIPRWPTKPWFNTFLDMLVGDQLVIPPHPDNLVLPNKPGEVHPLAEKLTLIVGRLSGKNTLVKDLMPCQLTYS